MLDQIRAAIQVASSVAEIPRQQAERFAREIGKMGDLRASQVTRITEDVVSKSRKNAQMVQSLISSEVKRQLKAVGLATRDDIDRMSRRVFSLANKEEVDRLSKRINDLESKVNAVRASPVKPVTKTATKAKPVTKPKAKSK